VAIKRETVEYVAHLARIELKEAQLDKLSAQLKEILDLIDKLNKLDVQGILPTSHILPLNNILRDDQPAASLPAEKTLENAPQKEKSFFSVPKVIE
jgi:aspartyl-tRNA(Asn)/glutamyl-tRNA(Gln) amidotransferase subunit C